MSDIGRHPSTSADGVELARVLGYFAELGKQAATTAAMVVNDAFWDELYVTYARVEDSQGPPRTWCLVTVRPAAS